MDVLDRVRDDGHPPGTLARRRFGLTLRTTVVFAAVVAAALAGLWVPIAGVQAATLVYLAILVTAMLTVTVIYGRGYVRTFAVGALFPAGVAFLCAFFGGGEDLFNYSRFFRDQPPAVLMVLAVAVVLGLILLAGLFAAGIRWMVESAQREDAPPDVHERRADEPMPREGSRATD